LELMREFAYPLPARVICELLGVPTDAVPLFLAHAPGLAVALDPSPMRTDVSVRAANEALRVLRAFLVDLIGARRRSPTDDLLSALVHAEAEGNRLSEDELVAMVLLLVVAGHETTANVIGNAMRRLIEHPEARRRLAAGDDDLVARAVEEHLRLDGPVQIAERIALEDASVDGLRIRKGQIVILAIGAANRDPNVFAAPEKLDLDRPRSARAHLAFGAGAHFCIGAPLARRELAAALPALARLPESLRVVGRPAVRDSFTIAGVERLDLAW
jgi:cytochrome P450